MCLSVPSLTKRGDIVELSCAAKRGNIAATHTFVLFVCNIESSFSHAFRNVSRLLGVPVGIISSTTKVRNSAVSPSQKALLSLNLKTNLRLVHNGLIFVCKKSNKQTVLFHSKFEKVSENKNKMTVGGIFQVGWDAKQAFFMSPKH